MQIDFPKQGASFGASSSKQDSLRCAKHESRAALGVARIFSKGEGIFAEGSRSEFFYQVMSGAVSTSQLLNDGRRQIASFHFPGDVFGIESAETHRFNAAVIETTTLVAYRRARLDQLVAEDGEFAQRIVVAMMRSLERAQAHMLLLGRKSALERIATFLLDLSERLADVGRIHLPMSRADIADHLGLTIETVSRSLTNLERQGIIELPDQRRSVLLIDRCALRRLDA